ncbi:MAG: diguanylate cyclase, partial [Dehalococcoidia bacterium]|nr:diguanylate cyclase [Dehalococcoidia bacterium]
VGKVAQTGEPLFIRDINKDSNCTRPGFIMDVFRSLACVPLVSGGKVLGVMTLGGSASRGFPPEERHLLVSIGNEIGVAMERAQLLKGAQDRALQLESLISVTREMASTLDLQEVLDHTLAIMCQQVGASHGFVCLLDEEKGGVTAQAFWGLGAPASGQPWKWEAGEGVVGWVAQHQYPIVCDDIAADQRIQGGPGPILGYPSIVAVPLKVKDKLLGVVAAVSQEKAAFTGADTSLLSAYASQAAMALENALLHQEVKRQASTDELTRLANRRYFYMRLDKELQRAKRYSHPLSLLFLDVDDLKTINDQYGHLQGDELLRHVAALLNRVLRATDVAARYGGDEFVVLLPETNQKEAAGVAERLLEEITPCPVITGGSIPWQMSIGVAWSPMKGSYEVDLLRLADEAAYQAKRDGPGWALAVET